MDISETMLAGDVLLVTGTTKTSKILSNGQKILYPKARSSHVLLGLGDGTFIHATSDGGVHLRFLLDELSEVEDSWRVIRLRNLPSDDSERIVIAALNFLRQEYNKKIFGPESESSSFCSELVAKAFRDSHIQIIDGKRPSLVTPSDFDRMADEIAEWKDVSEQYRACLPAYKEAEQMYRRGFETIQLVLAKRAFLSKSRATLFGAMIETASEDQKPKTKALVDKIKKNLRENRVLRFWDEKDAEP